MRRHFLRISSISWSKIGISITLEEGNLNSEFYLYFEYIGVYSEVYREVPILKSFNRNVIRNPERFLLHYEVFYLNKNKILKKFAHCVWTIRREKKLTFSFIRKFGFRLEKELKGYFYFSTFLIVMPFFTVYWKQRSGSKNIRPAVNFVLGGTPSQEIWDISRYLL